MGHIYTHRKDNSEVSITNNHKNARNNEKYVVSRITFMVVIPCLEFPLVLMFLTPHRC